MDCPLYLVARACNTLMGLMDLARISLVVDAQTSILPLKVKAQFLICACCLSTEFQ